MATRLYGVIWRWHFLAGVIACPVLFVVAITGAVYVFEPELERWSHEEILEVEPGSTRVPIDQLIATAATVCTPTGANVPGARDHTVVVYCREGHRREAYLDPYRGTLLGVRDVESTFFGVVFQLHWDLMLGEYGRLAVEWGSAWAALLLLSGAVLWWPRGKRRRAGVWYPRRALAGRQWLRDLHAVLGAYAVPVLALVVATGLMWTPLAGQERWHPLTEDAVHEAWDDPPSSEVVPGAARIGVDAALAAAGIDRARDRRSIYVEMLARPEQSYAFLLYDESFESVASAESIWIDAYAGTLLLALGWDDRSVLGKLDSAQYGIHVGALMSLPGRILACLAALILAALCVTGPWMWWKRRPAGQLGIPPRARHTPWALLALLGALGWLLPTVGVTLLVALVIEGALWLRRARSHASPPPASPG